MAESDLLLERIQRTEREFNSMNAKATDYRVRAKDLEEKAAKLSIHLDLLKEWYGELNGDIPPPSQPRQSTGATRTRAGAPPIKALVKRALEDLDEFDVEALTNKVIGLDANAKPSSVQSELFYARKRGEVETLRKNWHRSLIYGGVPRPLMTSNTEGESDGLGIISGNFGRVV